MRSFIGLALVSAFVCFSATASAATVEGESGWHGVAQGAASRTLRMGAGTHTVYVEGSKPIMCALLSSAGEPVKVAYGNNTCALVWKNTETTTYTLKVIYNPNTSTSPYAFEYDATF